MILLEVYGIRLRPNTDAKTRFREMMFRAFKDASYWNMFVIVPVDDWWRQSNEDTPIVVRITAYRGIIDQHGADMEQRFLNMGIVAPLFVSADIVLS